MVYNNGNYPKGIWCIDNDNSNMALKILNDRIIKVPQTKEILEEIKKQIEANKVFNAFQQINIEDENIIGYLNVILTNYVNFLDVDNLNRLINTMTQITKINCIDNQNILYITNLTAYLQTNNMENFEETLKEFYSYNQPYFAKAFATSETPKKH